MVTFKENKGNCLSFESNFFFTDIRKKNVDNLCGMSAYDFNPDVCLQIFHGIAEEIPSGVSGNDLKAVVCPEISFPQELLGYIRNTIISTIKNSLDWFWEKYQISKKLKCLEELEQKSPRGKAWRPTTGKADTNLVIAKNLRKIKTELMEEIKLVREESAMILPYLEKFSEEIKQQLEEINSIEKTFLNLQVQ